MKIEKGEYFVVKRGFKMGKSLSLFVGAFGIPPPANEEDQYSRDWNGCVFEALEECDEAIAARVVFVTESYKRDQLGRVVSLNGSELELWPVTKAYFEALTQPSVPLAP